MSSISSKFKPQTNTQTFSAEFLNKLTKFTVCGFVSLLTLSANTYAIDADGDGSDAVEEALAGTSDNNPNERPYWWKTFNGDSGSDRLGYSISGAGDVNADGYADFIAGAPNDDINGFSSGSAHVYSGVDGAVLYTVSGDETIHLGRSVSGAGDVNDDGYADFIIGAYWDDNNGIGSGSARVYSGVDGSLLYMVNGDNAGDQLGYSVSGAGDVNGDGYDDFIAGAPYDDNNETDCGSARVYSGVDGTVLYTVSGDGVDDHVGFSVSGAGDVNADGYADFIINDHWGNSNNGTARVHSGLDGSTLYTVNGDSAGDHFGGAVSGAGDVNADGYADFIIGATGDNNGNGNGSGSARVFSGVDSSVLYTVNGDSASSSLGFSVSGAGDINGDGYADFIAGAPSDDINGSNSGIARVFSGVDGMVLYTLSGDSANSDLGWSVSGAGDVNSDGYADIIVGSYSGEAHVYLSSDLINDVDTDFIINSVDLDNDNDGLSDIDENTMYFTDPLNSDTDDDGFSDADEVLIFNTDPLVPDGDNDTDGEPDSYDIDDDNDGLPDVWEVTYGLDSLDANGDNGPSGDFDDDSATNLLEYQRETNPADALSFPIVSDNDFDNDGDGDLLFFDSSTGSVVLWTLQDANKVSGSWLGNYPGRTARVITDINNDCIADALFAWGGSISRMSISSGTMQSVGVEYGYDLVKAGKLNNDNYADLIFEDNDGAILIWLMQSDYSKQSEVWIGTWAGQSVAAVGDIDNDGDDDIITQDASGNVNVIEMENGAKVAARWVGQWAGRTIVGAGDADNDGDADIFMESTSPSGDVMVIEIQNGLKVTGRWLGTWAGTEVKAIGDIDQDGDVDLIQQNTGSGSVQVVEIEDANKVTGRWLGTFAYDVKGVIDADADGDVDVAMQDGSGNVALIELENGSKVGGAKWLGVNAGEMKLFP